MKRQFRVQDLLSLVAVVAVMLMVIVNITGLGLSHCRGYSRLSCSNNMRQVALALIQYANTYQKFPPSELSKTGTSGLVFTLPYLEEQYLYNSYNLELPRWAPENEAAVGKNVRLFTCPDSVNISPTPAASVRRLDGTIDPGSSSYAKGHYAVNWGGGRGGWGRDFETTVGRNRGVMRSVTDVNMGGPLPLIGTKDLKDGASTTLLLIEKRDSQGWAVGGWAGSEFDVGTSPGMKTGDPWGDKVYSGSYHSVGVNATLCDGSVHTIFAKIDRKVWYALITRDGGKPLEGTDIP